MKLCDLESLARPERDQEKAEELGRQITAARERRGVTLRELARRSGLSPSYIHRIEHGYDWPVAATVRLLVEAMGQ